MKRSKLGPMVFPAFAMLALTTACSRAITRANDSDSNIKSTSGGSTLSPPVASDCTYSTDQTSALNNWIANTVQDGDTISLDTNGCYRIDGSLTFTGRHDITIEGHNATLKATTNIPSGYRARLTFNLGGGFVVRNVNLEGTYGGPSSDPTGTSFGDTNIHITGTDGVLIENSRLLNTWGDGVLIQPGGDWNSQGVGAVQAKNITIKTTTIDTAGRHGVAVTHGHNVAITDNVITNVQSWIVDLETEAATWAVDAAIERNQFSNSWFGFVAAHGNVGPIVINDNTQTAAANPSICVQSIDIGAPGQNIGEVTITNNSLRTITDGITLRGVKFPKVTIRDNTLQYTAGGCAAVRPGIVVDNVASGSIAHNSLLGYAPLVVANDSAAHNCGNRGTSPAPFDNPTACESPCNPPDAGSD